MYTSDSGAGMDPRVLRLAEESGYLRERRKKRPKFDFADIILHEDDTLLAVNKPAGITSLAERENPNSGLLDIARRYHADLKLCHRLDRNTSGVLLFAKGDEAYRHVAMQFEGREVEKHYKTIVAGSHDWNNLVVDVPLAPISAGVVRVDHRDGRQSLTVFNTAERFRTHTYVDALPVTGRSHQIRVHLAHVGHPILGDELYGGPNLLLSTLKRGYKLTDDEERPLNDGYLLHAHGLVVTHPGTAKRVPFTAPLPKQLQVCLDVLRKYSAIRA